MTRYWIGLLFMVLFCHCNSQKEVQQKMQNLDQEFYEYTAYTVAQTELIQSSSQWEKAHHKLFQNQYPEPELEAIDFNKQSVALVAFGEKRTGGYYCEAVSYSVNNDTLELVLKKPKSDPYDAVSMALTQPVLVCKIPKINARIVTYTFKE